MSGVEQFAPPVYACAAGAVLHGHAGETLEPGVLLYTFLPPDAADALRSGEPRVDVHGDGPGAATVTVRALAGEASLSWQLPIAPLVAALPGQTGNDGRMVLLAVVDAEPEAAFWAAPVDCGRLAAELQLPVAELVEALRGRLTPWLQEDLQVLMHDDAHDRALDRSPAQTLAEAVLAQYRGDLEAEQSVLRLLRALALAPADYSVELGARLCSALVTALEAAPPAAVQAVREQTGPFESEVLRVLDDLPARLAAASPGDRTGIATDFLVAGEDRDEAVRGAISVVTRLARATFGADLGADDLLRRLGMVDDAGLVRLAELWVAMARAAADAGDDVAAADITSRLLVEGRPGVQWLEATASSLMALTVEVARRQLDRVAAPLDALRRLLEGEEPPSARSVAACLELARFVRASGRVGPGLWLQGPAAAAASAVMRGYADGLDPETTVDLLSELLEEDVDGVDLLDGFVCATAQLLVQVEPMTDDALRQTQVNEVLSAVPAGPRGGRWLLAACLREAHEHDAGAIDLAPLLPRDAAVDPDRAAEKAGRSGMLRAGLSCLDALSATFGEEAQLPRQDMLTLVFPTALAEHELLRQP